MAMGRWPHLALDRPLRWSDVYREAELYKAVVRVYTKPLFQWRKALSTSTDGKTLYDLAGPACAVWMPFTNRCASAVSNFVRPWP